jgi:beta-glucanase (GH16 family)
LPGYFESFDNGLGSFDHTWGDADTSKSGQVTLRGNSGVMIDNPTHKSMGTGYGYYEVKASMSADKIGPAVVLWPGNNEWPGGEYDMVEVIHGRAYGTVHWDAGGKDGYDVVDFHGVNETQVHTYGLEWEEDRITYSVDGQEMGSIGHNVGRDYAHGGTDVVMSLMNGSNDTHLTVYEVSYTPSDDAWG